MTGLHILSSHFEEMLSKELLGETALTDSEKRPTPRDFEILEELFSNLIDSEGNDINIWKEIFNRVSYFRHIEKSVANDILTSDFFQCFILGIQNEEIAIYAFDLFSAMIFPGSFFNDDLLEKDIALECAQYLQKSSNTEASISALKCISSLYTLNQDVAFQLQETDIPKLIFRCMKVSRIDTYIFNRTQGVMIESIESKVTKQALRTLKHSTKFDASHIALHFSTIEKCMISHNEEVQNIALYLAYRYFSSCGEDYKNIEISQLINTFFAILKSSESVGNIHQLFKVILQMSASASLTAILFDENVVERFFNYLTSGGGWSAEAASTLENPTESNSEPVIEAVKNRAEFVPDILKIFSNMSAHVIISEDGSQLPLLSVATERDAVAFALIELRDGPYGSSMSACFVLAQILLLADYDYIQTVISDEMFTLSFDYLEEDNKDLSWMLVDGYAAFLDKAMANGDGERATAILSEAHDALSELAEKGDSRSAESATMLLQRLE